MKTNTFGTRISAAALGPSLALSLALTLGACGQSGPLYLPGNPSQVQVEKPEDAADPEARDESEDDDRDDDDRGQR